MIKLFDLNVSQNRNYSKSKSLLDNLTIGIIVLKSIRNNAGNILDFEYQLINRKAAQLSEIESLPGGRLGADSGNSILAPLFSKLVSAAQFGQHKSELVNSPKANKPLHLSFIKQEDGVLIQIIDLSELQIDQPPRMPANDSSAYPSKLDSYRLSLSDALQALSDPVAIKTSAVRFLGKRLKASRLLCAEAPDETGSELVLTEYCKNIPSLAGQHCIHDYGAVVMAELRAGRVVKIEDTATDPQISLAEIKRMAELNINACVLIPLSKNSRLAGFLAVHQDKPRVWQQQEITLMEETADRIWFALQRAQAEQNMREREERQSLLVLLTDTLQTLTESADIQWEAACILGKYLETDRTFYADVYANENFAIVRPDYFREGLGSIAGQYKLSDFQDSWGIIQENKTTLVTDDVLTATSMRNSQNGLVSLNIRASICVPLFRGNRLISSLNVSTATPRKWTSSEVAPAEEFAQRTWDAVERARAIELLRVSEERFRSIFNYAGTGIAITDLSGYFHICNDAFMNLLGYNQKELSRITFPELIYPDDAPANMMEIRRLQNEEIAFFEIESRYVRKNGEPVWVHKSMTLLRDARGAPAYSLALVTDITGRRQMELALRDADTRKNEFLAMLGHELRNPLTPINTVTELMCDKPLEGELYTWACDVLNRNVDIMSRLVNDLLDVSRITRGLVNLQQENVELAKIINDSLEPVQALIQSKKQSINCRIPDKPIYLHADSIRLTQVFTNLIHNAAKYTPESGAIEIAVAEEQDTVSIRVSDNGAGLAPELKPYIFDLFTQGIQGYERTQGGLGIGLTLVKKLIDLHGGTISAESSGVGQGSVFTVRLPVFAQETAALNQPCPNSANNEVYESLRILLIDDNHDVSDSVAAWLNSIGHQVAIAPSGTEGISTTVSYRPEIILLDIGLPDMNGYLVARKLRELPSGDKIMIIAVSGYAPDSDEPGHANKDFDHYLIKPPKTTQLKQIINEYRLSKRPQ